MKHILLAIVAALAVVLGSTGAAVASTGHPADANDVVSVALEGNLVNDQGDLANDQGDVVPDGPVDGFEAESSEGNPITDGTATGLPPGLSIIPEWGYPGSWMYSGTISDTTPPGNYTVTVTATDSAGKKGTAKFTWTIYDPVTVTNPGNQSSRLGAAVSLQINSNRSNPTAAGLPPGLTINEFTGLISGTPTQAGRYTVTVTESEQGADGGTISGSATFTWTVSSGPTVHYSGTIRLTQMGLYLDDRNNSSANGAIVQVWQHTGGPNQVWQVMSDGTIRHNGLCLDAVGGGKKNGTKVDLWACGTGKPNQQWNTRNSRITNPSSGKVLNDAGYGGNGTQQELWSNTGTINEIWATS